MMPRFVVSLVLASYLAAAIVPCPVTGSAEVSASRAAMGHGDAGGKERPGDPLARHDHGADNADPTHHAHPPPAADLHAHHAHHAHASDADEQATRERAPAGNAIGWALTLPCPCGCGDKANGAASGGKRGPRLLAQGVALAEAERPGVAEASPGVPRSRALPPPDTVPIEGFAFIS